jgi:GNAT superfamily N-acetyltransferase
MVARRSGSALRLLGESLVIKIERAKPADADEIRNVAYQSWRAAYRDIFTLDFINDFFARNFTDERLVSAILNDIFLVARDGERIVALAHAGTRDSITTLYRLYALPDYWRSGVGGKLLDTLEATLTAHNVSQYQCFVQSKNEVGKQFYLKRGFTHVPERDHDDEWYMMKHLSAVTSQ